MLISFSLCHLQRFKGTEPIEEVTEQVKAVKIEEKPKEVKEVVDEVQLQDVDFCRCCYCWQFIFHLWPCTLTNFRCSCFSQGPPKYTKSVLKKGDKVNFPKKGETVSCWYTGSLEDGTVFDTNIPAGMTNEQFNSWECRASLFTTWNHSVFVVNANSNRLEWSSGLNLPSSLSAAARKKRQTKPLSFKAGLGRVIRGVSNEVFFCSVSPNLFPFHSMSSSDPLFLTVGWGHHDDEQGWNGSIGDWTRVGLWKEGCPWKQVSFSLAELRHVV